MKTQLLRYCATAALFVAGHSANAAVISQGTFNLQIDLSGFTPTTMEWGKNLGTPLETWSLGRVQYTNPWSTKVSASKEVNDSSAGWSPLPEAFSISYNGSSVANSNSLLNDDPFKPKATTSVTAFHDGISTSGDVYASGQYVYMAGLYAITNGSFTYKATVGGSGQVDTNNIGDLAQVSQSLSTYIMRGAWTWSEDNQNWFIQYEDNYIAEDAVSYDWPNYFLHKDGADGSYSGDNLASIEFTVDFNAGDYFLIRTDAGMWARAFAAPDTNTNGIPEPSSLVLAGLGALGLALLRRYKFTDGKRIAVR